MGQRGPESLGTGCSSPSRKDAGEQGKQGQGGSTFCMSLPFGRVGCRGPPPPCERPRRGRIAQREETWLPGP